MEDGRVLSMKNLNPWVTAVISTVVATVLVVVVALAVGDPNWSLVAGIAAALAIGLFVGTSRTSPADRPGPRRRRAR